MKAEPFSVPNSLPSQAAEAAHHARERSAQKAHDNEAKPASAPPTVAEARSELDRGVVESLFGDSGKRDANAMRILYKEAVGKLEEVLREALGDEEFSLARLAEKTSGIGGQEDYWSAEKTADRIATGATAHFEAFQRQNPDLGLEEQVDRFLEIIGGAVDQGYGEAASLLEGLGVFDGTIRDTAEKTLQLVHEKLATFRERMIGEEADPEAASAEQPVLE